MSEITFDSMGSAIRIVAEAPLAHGAAADEALAGARAWTADFARRLSRFEPDSELSRAERGSRAIVPASPLLRAAVGAAPLGGGAHRRTDRPDSVGALEAAGYRDSRAGVRAAPLAEALAGGARAPSRPAEPGRRAGGACDVRDDAASIRARPACASTPAAPARAWPQTRSRARLRGFGRFAVDCGGDIRDRRRRSPRPALQVDVQHPLTGDVAMSCELGGGGVATSGLDVRLWRARRRRFAHHLLDPSTGEPAWTGLVGATALGATALEAETLAKAALLSGPGRGRALLAEHGGVLVRTTTARRGGRSCSRAARRRGSVTRRPGPRRSTVWWLASRAAGVIAFVLVTVSVGLGLTMAGRLARGPGLAQAAARSTSRRRSARWSRSSCMASRCSATPGCTPG